MHPERRVPRSTPGRGLNEPYMNGVEEARRAARFEKAFSDRIQELGRKSVVLNLAVGNPGDMEIMLLPEVVDLLGTADYAGYHAYGGDKDQLLIGPQSPWFANRWRFYAEMYHDRRLRMPPVIYTEVNTFNQWKGKIAVSVVRDNLIAFEKVSRKDPWAVWHGRLPFRLELGRVHGTRDRERAPDLRSFRRSQPQLPGGREGRSRLAAVGSDGGDFEGGVAQPVPVRAGASYRLSSSMKYETRRARSRPSFEVGYDLTGQTTDAAASTVT